MAEEIKCIIGTQPQERVSLEYALAEAAYSAQEYTEAIKAAAYVYVILLPRLFRKDFGITFTRWAIMLKCSEPHIIAIRISFTRLSAKNHL